LTRRSFSYAPIVAQLTPDAPALQTLLRQSGAAFAPNRRASMTTLAQSGPRFVAMRNFGGGIVLARIA